MKTIKLMKWMTAAVVLLMMTVSVTFAQQGQRRGTNVNPEERAQRTVERMAERLNLNQEQKDGIYQIQLKQIEERQKAFANRDDAQDRQELRAQMAAMRKENRQKIMNLLNDDQKVEYQKMQEEQRQNRRNNNQRRGGRSADRTP